MAKKPGEIIRKDLGLQKILKRVRKADRLAVVAGILADAGARAHESGLTIAELATIHEFGAPSVNIPARPFIKTTVRKNLRRYREIERKAAREVFSNRKDLKDAITELRDEVRRDISNTIVDGDGFEPLSPLTRKKVGIAGPDAILIDTGELVSSIGAKVGKL